jgi:hypothetical protein
MGYRLDDTVGRGMRLVSLSKLWVPPSLLFSGLPRVLLSGVKRLRVWSDHLPPPSDENKNEFNHTFTYPYVFVACRKTTVPVTLLLNKLENF